MATSPSESGEVILPRIFVDTSTIYAGLGSRTGASNALLIIGEIGLLRIVTCPYVIDEVERNITLKAPELRNRYQELIRNGQWEISLDPSIEEVRPWVTVIRPKDAPVLAGAIKAKADRLVTLDKHDFTPEVGLKSGLIITSPGALIRELRSLIATEFAR
jgi:predicted nucleic acid-binding protein